MEGKKVIKENIIYNVAQTVMSVLYPLVTFMYVTKKLSVEGIGQVIFTKNIAAYFCLAASLGIYYYGVREGAKVAKDKGKFSKLFWEIMIINIVTTFTSWLVFIICIFLLPDFSAYKVLLLINSISVVCDGLISNWVFASQERYKYMAVCTMLLQIFCLVGMFVFIQNEGDIIPYAVLLIISTYGIAIFNWIYIARSRMVSKVNFASLEFKKHLKPILVLFAMLLSIDCYTMLDTTMLGFIKGDYSVGIYNAAIKVPRLVNSFVAAVGVVLVPRLSYYYEVNRANFYKLINLAIEFVFFSSIPCAIFVFFLSKDAIFLICGSKYVDSILVLRILVPLSLIIPISVLFNNQIFIPIRKEKFVLQGVLTGTVINVILNLFLIPMNGPEGAAIASVAAELAVMITCIYYVKRELQLNDLLKRYLNILVRNIPIAIALFLITRYMNYGLIRLVVCGFVCLVLITLFQKKELYYFASLFKFRK